MLVEKFKYVLNSDRDANYTYIMYTYLLSSYCSYLHIPVRFRRITRITQLTTTDWNFSFFDASDQKYKISSSKTPSPEKPFIRSDCLFIREKEKTRCIIFLDTPYVCRFNKFPTGLRETPQIEQQKQKQLQRSRKRWLAVRTRQQKESRPFSRTSAVFGVCSALDKNRGTAYGTRVRYSIRNTRCTEAVAPPDPMNNTAAAQLAPPFSI